MQNEYVQAPMDPGIAERLQGAIQDFHAGLSAEVEVLLGPSRVEACLEAIDGGAVPRWEDLNVGAGFRTVLVEVVGGLNVELTQQLMERFGTEPCVCSEGSG